MSFQQFLMAYMANLDGFTPELTVGLVSWMDAADESTIELIGNGAYANSWQDKALLTRYGRIGYDEGTQNSRPRYSSTGRNGKPSLRWDNEVGISKYYNMDNTVNLPTGNSNSSIMVVGYYSTTSSRRVILGWGNTATNANNQITAGLLGSGPMEWGWDTYTDYLEKGASKSGVTATEYSDFILYQTNLRSGTASDMHAKFNINGSANANVGGVITSVNVTNHFYTIGRDVKDLGQYWDHSEAQLQEILIYNTELSSTTRKKMEGYLAHKWGLTSNLPTDHPYKNTAPTNDWDPDGSLGLVSWFDASDKSTFEIYNSTTVNTWFDKADSNNFGQQTSATAKPTYSDTARNSKPGVVFTASNSQRLALNNIVKYPVASTDSSIFVVGQSSTTGVWQTAIAWGDTSGTGGQRSVSKGGTLNNHAWDTWAGSSEVGIEWNSDAIVCQEFVFTTGDDYAKFIINGNTNTTIVGTTAGNAVTDTLRGNIGSNAGTSGGDPWDGVIQEILVFDRSVSSLLRQKIEGYLAHKWGLTSLLRSDHPYKTTAPKKTWEPNFIPNLVGWFDAYDDQSLIIWNSPGDETLVNTWINKVNTSITASQTTDAEKPKYSTTARNSKPGLIFDGTDDRLPLNAITNLPTGQANSVIMAVANTTHVGSSVQDPRLISWGGTTGTAPMRGLGTLNTTAYHVMAGWNGPESNSGIQWSGDNIVYQAYLKSGTSDMYAKYHINGSSTANIGRVLVGASTTTSRGTIGDSATTTDSNHNWHGTIQEILIFNQELPNALRQKVEGYLAHKWGLTSLLPSDHPYKTEAP